MPKKKLDAERIKRLYLEEMLSLRDIATQENCSPAGTKELLLREGVQLRGPAGARAGKGYVSRKLDASLICQMYLEGEKSTLEIATALNCSRNGVRIVLSAHNIEMRNTAGLRTKKVAGFVPTHDWMLEVMPHFDSATAAAKHYEVPYATWIDWMKKFNIERERPGSFMPSKRRQEIPIEEAVQLSNEGKTYQELAERYGVSYGVIVRRMKDVGHKAPWRRTKDPRFTTHSTKKRKVLQELNITACEICGEDRALDFAHIKPAANGGPVEKENCLVLCSTHHRVYDSGQMTEEEFSHVLPKVRAAEALYSWTNDFYGGW